MDLPPVEDSPSELLRYPVGDDESIVEATTEAFEEVGVDVYDRERTLQEWAGHCKLPEIEWEADPPCRVTTVIWDHPTVITADAVSIRERPDDG